ncbi:MAG: hypothetical protein OEL76_07490 [Siculibacillus sp.]|nr:hypothetical protein [Siculibacillus sp.]
MTKEHDEQDFDLADPRLAIAGGPRRLRDDPLLRLLGINWLIGAGVAAALAIVVLITDTAHLRSLMMSSSEPWIPMLLLFFGFMVTMCSVAMGAAVMFLPKDDDDDEPKGGMKLEVLKLPQLRPALAPVRAGATNPRRRPLA